MTSSRNPVHQLHALRTLAEAIQLRIQAELDWLEDAGSATPLLRTCLNRARGHLELAADALSQTRPESAFARRRRGSKTKGRTLELRKDPRATAAERAAHGKASSWAHGRVEEIGRALETGLGRRQKRSGAGSPSLDDPDQDCPPDPDGAEGSAAYGDSVSADASEAAAGRSEGAAPTPRPLPPPHFSGCTEVLSIPDLVGFFQTQAKTGVLEIEHASEAFRLEFERGELIHAASARSPAGERLGEILVRRGALTEERLAELLAQLSRGERVGTALVRLGDVSQADLTAAVEEQVLGIFVRLARLPGCSFTFRERTFERDLACRVRHNVMRLLLDSARQIDDEERARRDPA